MNNYDANNRVDTTKLLDFLTIKYGFDGFYHYTDYSNLRSIFGAQALLARNTIKSGFHDSADPYVLTQPPDWIHDHVRLFYFPQTPFLYRNEGIKPTDKSAFGESFIVEAHMPRPVALRFNKAIAYMKGIKYCNGSASYVQAANEDHRTIMEKYARDAMKFDWCFIASREPYSRTRYVCGRDLSNATITNYKNAEILIPNKLPLSYLDQILFRSEADRKQAVMEFGANKLYHVYPRAFHNNRTYLLDYELTWDKGSDQIHIDLELLAKIPLEKYSHVMKLYSESGLRREEEFNLRNRDESLDLYDCRDITKVEYYMDDILCAAWEANRW